MSKPGRIPDLVVQDLIGRADLAQLIGESVQLKRAGQNYSGLCPFHEEKTPSFTVSPIKNFYYCFGCAASGNAISFLMDYHHLSFVAACENLAQRLGIQIQYEQSSNHATQHKQKQPTDHLMAAHELAQQFFVDQLRHLPDHHPVKHYLRQRNITQKSIDQFEIGYAPPGWESLKQYLHQHGLSEKDALEAGLLTQGKNNKVYDRFRSRLIFPIRNIKGQTIAFGGRTLSNEQPKYLNSPESAVFQKREALYGLAELAKGRKTDKILVAEGYFDVVRMHQVELPYAVAALGTATSEHHLRTLFRLSDHLIACFDGDTAGEKAAWRFLEHSLPLIQSQQRVDFLFLPAGEDPDSFIAKQGKNAFLVEEKKAKGLSEFFIEKLTADLKLHQLDDRAMLLKRALPLVQKIGESFLQELLLQRLSEIIQIPIERLEQVMASGTANSHTHSRAKASHNHGAVSQQSNAFEASASTSFVKNSYTKKSWQKSGGRKWREQSPPQPLPKFQNLIDAMLRLLLQQPELAKTYELTLECKPNLPGFSLFESVYQQLRSDPEASLAYLMGLWHELPEGEYIAKLAAEEFLVPNHSLDMEFVDGLSQLETLALNEALATAARTKPLDREKLKLLMEKKQQREAQKAASATVPSP